jgi:adenosyl cobinamide kinase/adenosyl cobinamide phosphate guanylyltransferase
MNILQTGLNAKTIKGCLNNQNNNDYTTRITKYKFTRIKEWLRNSNCEKYDAAIYDKHQHAKKTIVLTVKVWLTSLLGRSCSPSFPQASSPEVSLLTAPAQTDDERKPERAG